MHCHYVAWAILGLLAVTPAVWGFDKKLHRVYASNVASAYVSACSPAFKQDDLDRIRAQVPEGAIAEDELTLDRAVNWHFYNRDGAVGDSLLARHNWDVIFAQRIGQFERRAVSRDADRDATFFALGRVLHYIHDASVPAHVVPVYHVKIKGVKNLPDAFDGYELLEPASVLPTVSPDRCAEIRRDESAAAPSFVRILERTATETLKAIGQHPDAPAHAARWADYWGNPQVSQQRDGAKKGFAKYGKCVFGPKQKSALCPADSAAFDAFFIARYTRVLEDGIRVLIRAEQLMLP